MFRKRKKKLKYKYRPKNLVTLSESQSFISEQFRTIRTNINFSLPDHGSRAILITSSIPGEGKSTNAANLAVVFAQEGKKVLLIDADMRKPTLHLTFNLQNTIGLSNILVGKHYIYNGIQETPIVGLFTLTSGPIPPNPAELLSSKNMDLLLEFARENYNIIIIDAPPLLSVTDGQILGNKCDGTLLIINSGVTDRSNVLKAKNVLISSHAKILGVVLNNYKISSKDYYNYYYQ